MTEVQSTERPANEPDMVPSRGERAFNIPGIIVAIIVLLVGIHVVRAYVLTSEQDLLLILRGAFIPVRYTGGYTLDLFAFTSPVSYSLLHGGFDHLFVNLIWLVAFGSPLAQRLGVFRFLLFWVASSLAAAGLHFALHSTEMNPLVGASGAIAGMMGAAARFAFQIDRSRSMPAFSGSILPIGIVLRNRGVFIFLLVWMIINVVTGLYSLTPDGGGIAWEAHVGGFLLGFFCIRLFDKPGAEHASSLEMKAGASHHADTDEIQLPEEEPGASDGRKPR